MNLSQRQIRAFLTIARLQSITRAAEELHITQAGLSSMLRDIETQLECRLFDRTTRAVSLTQQGRAFVPVAERVLSDLEGAAATLSRLSESRQRTLSVGATPLVASCLLPAACTAFASAWPDIEVEVHDLDRAQIQEQVKDGRIDVGYGVFLEAASGMRRVPLLKTELVLVSPAPASSRKRVRTSWRNFERITLVGLPISNPIQKLVDSHLAVIGRGNEPRRVFNHLLTVLAMVEAGVGCAILPAFATAAAPRYKLSIQRIEDPTVSLEFFEITKKGAQVASMTKPFGRCLVAAMT
jgi:DNA-binding transcriptional LysR family regulator